MNDTHRPSSSGPQEQSAANPDMAALKDASLGVFPSVQSRLAAVMNVARYHGVEMNLENLRLQPDEPAPAPPVLIDWLKEAGLWARGIPMTFRHIIRIDDPAPIVLLLDDGSAALVVGRNREKQVLMLRDPRARPSDPAVPVDELRLKQVWSGGALLVRASRHGVEDEAAFNMSLLAKLVWMDKSILRDIAIASITITILSVLPILMVMRTVSTVIQYHSIATLDLVIVILFICVFFEMILSWGRKMLQVTMAAKLDARLNLMIFNRLLSLPIEFFEREQAGTLSYKIGQTYQVREFLPGKLMNTFIDVFMVALLLPLLFYMNATLAWTILISASIIAGIIAAFLRPLGIMTGKIVAT